jgi:hypothetical protein
MLTLLWQLLALLACCSGISLFLRFLFPKEFSLLNKVLFTFVGGLCLVVLIPENLVYLCVPVRISAWLLLAAAVFQVCLCRHQLIAWRRMLYSDADLRTLAVIIVLTVTFHGAVPILQGLEGYYGKANPDQLNYVVLAEFLKEEPYSTAQPDIGLRPWLLRAVGFQDPAERLRTSTGPGPEMVGLKKGRIGQSIVTSEISVWSGTNAKGGYAATVIFFLTVLAICLFGFLRETGINRFMAGSGALMAALLPAVTRLSLDGFLSQVSTLFVFPFFAILLQRQELSARSFTLFFSLGLAYLIAAYSEIAPIGLCTFFLGLMFIRHDTFRAKRLMLMSAILLIAFANLYYLRNLIEFLERQYYVAANADMMHMAPNILTLRGWSELNFGAFAGSPLALLFDGCTILLGVIFLAGAIFLPRHSQEVIGVILVPVILVIAYLAIRAPASYYSMAKIVLSALPFVIGLVFVALSKVATKKRNYPLGALKKLLSAIIVTGAAAGSVRYYHEVLNNDGLLSYVREPRFLKVCRELEAIKNKRVLVFETYPLLTQWLCYHARHNDVYFDIRAISDSAFPQLFPFLKVPDLENVDFVVARDRLVDLKAPAVSCLTLVGETTGEDLASGRIHYWLGPPVGLRFLAVRPFSANLAMQLAPGREAKTFPIDFFLTDDHGNVSQGEIWSKSVDVRRLNFPRGLSRLVFSVKARVSDQNGESSFPILAELDELQITDIK